LWNLEIIIIEHNRSYEMYRLYVGKNLVMISHGQYNKIVDDSEIELLKKKRLPHAWIHEKYKFKSDNAKAMFLLRWA